MLVVHMLHAIALVAARMNAEYGPPGIKRGEILDMAIDEQALNKGQARKLGALRKSVGDDLAEEVFAKWLKRQTDVKPVDRADPVADKIATALAGLEKDQTFRLGNRGYTIRRARGKGASGFIVTKNE